MDEKNENKTEKNQKDTKENENYEQKEDNSDSMNYENFSFDEKIIDTSSDNDEIPTSTNTITNKYENKKTEYKETILNLISGQQNENHKEKIDNIIYKFISKDYERGNEDEDEEEDDDENQNYHEVYRIGDYKKIKESKDDDEDEDEETRTNTEKKTNKFSEY